MIRNLSLERGRIRGPLPSRREEHIDIMGSLRVPCVRSSDRAPRRAGWTPRWVNIDLDASRNQGVPKVIYYSRKTDL